MKLGWGSQMHTVLMGKRFGKQLLRRLRMRWEDNIKGSQGVNLCENGRWVEPAKD
jgi:hypothetical protein